MQGGTRWTTPVAWLWDPIPATEAVVRDGHGRVLALCLLAAFVLRLGIAWWLPSIHHADEVYQVGEQANVAARGYGIVPWEFRTASRTVILPTLVEPIYALVGDAAVRRLLKDAVFCGLSLLTVWVAFAWTHRRFGTAGAVLAAGLQAMWFELVYFAPKATADAVAAYLLLAGVYLGRPTASVRAVFVSGVLLALTWAVRVQVTPAVGLTLLLVALVHDRARRSAVVTGAAAGLMTAAIVEWAWWGVPLQGQVGYLVMEWTNRSSQYFGSEPLIFYFKQYILMYGAALPLIAWFMYLGARQAPILLLVAAAVIVPFHAIGHKEYRFVVTALPPLVLLMGLGVCDLCGRFQGSPWRKTLAVVGGGAIAMLAVSFGDTYRPMWTRFGNHVLAFEAVGRQPDACGVALVGIRWWHTPGYGGIGRDVPIYEMRTPESETRLFEAANYVLQATKAEPPPPPFERFRGYTRPEQFLYRRPGSCTPDAAAAVRFPPGIPGID